MGALNLASERFGLAGPLQYQPTPIDPAWIPRTYGKVIPSGYGSRIRLLRHEDHPPILPPRSQAGIPRMYGAV